VLLIIIALSAAYRTIFLFYFPPGPDEAFYWIWGQRLDWSYAEHPPLVAWIIRLMSEIFGQKAYASRLVADAMAIGTSLFLYRAGSKLFDQRVGFWAGALHAVSPLYATAGGVMLLPESVLTFWITLGLWLASILIMENDRRQFYRLGVVLGLAMLTKYPGILVLAALGLFAICSKPHRRWFLMKEPYVMAVIGLAMFAPVIYWNVAHDWAGIAFINQRTVAGETANPLLRVLQSFVAQAGYQSPVLFALMLFGVGAAAYRGFVRKEPRWLLLFCFSGPVIIAFLTVSAFRETLPHWPAAGYLAAFVAAPAALLTGGSGKYRVGLLRAAAAIEIFTAFLLPLMLTFPLTTIALEGLRGTLPVPEDYVEPTAEATGWNEEIRARVLAEVNELREETGAEPVVLSHFHMLAALINYHLWGQCDVFSIHANAHQYNMWYGDDDVVGRPVLYVSSDNSSKYQGSPEEFYVFDECHQLEPLEIRRHGLQLNTVYFWTCTGYQGAKP
jgi:4-amino-4-deoxy-L-arabinose transferase-like glycosyltransferase